NCLIVGYFILQMGKKVTSNPEAKKARALWDNASWTTTFCDLCVEQIDAGHRTSGACFSRKGWAILVPKFCEQTGLDYDKDQEGVGDSDGSSEFKDNQCDMSLDIDSLQQGHTSQSRSSGQKRTSELKDNY
ncbi:hypothetical protein SO802_011634, partial [Lithocarpus litseifolius]